MFSRNRWAFALTCFILLALFPALASAQAPVEVSGTEEIEQFDVELVIGKEGNVDVTETIRYRFGPGEKHGIYRDIPEDYVTSIGTRESIELTIKSVQDGEGKNVAYEESHVDGNLRIKIGDPDRLVSGVMIYVIRYRAIGAVSFFEDFDELYWDAIGNDWIVPIQSSSVAVRTVESTKDVRFACYVGQYKSAVPCDEEIPKPLDTKRGVRVVWNEPLPAGAGLTVALGFSKGSVTEPTLFIQVIRFLLNNPLILLPFAVFAFMFRRWRREGRDPQGRGTIIPEYDVPLGLTPLHIAALQTSRVNGKAIPSAIIDLAVKGYLRIERIDKDGFIFDSTDYRFTESRQQPPTGTIEAALIQALFGTATQSAISIKQVLSSSLVKFIPNTLKQSMDAIPLKENNHKKEDIRTTTVSDLKNEFYSKIPELQKRAIADLVRRKLYEASPQDVWGKYVLWGFIILVGTFFLAPLFDLSGASIAALFVTIPIYVVFVYLMPRVTLAGAIAKEQLLGLKDYLQIAEKNRLEFHNAPEKTPELFERLLPAALLLGVSDIWAKEFADISISEPEWYRGGDAASFSAASFATDLGGFNTAAESSLASVPSGSGSGGGGFSGGGSGGGGGGSW